MLLAKVFAWMVAVPEVFKANYTIGANAITKDFLIEAYLIRN
jgi:hypothetical protein